MTPRLAAVMSWATTTHGYKLTASAKTHSLSCGVMTVSSGLPRGVWEGCGSGLPYGFWKLLDLVMISPCVFTLPSSPVLCLKFPVLYKHKLDLFSKPYLNQLYLQGILFKQGHTLKYFGIELEHMNLRACK